MDIDKSDIRILVAELAELQGKITNRERVGIIEKAMGTINRLFDDREKLRTRITELERENAEYRMVVEWDGSELKNGVEIIKQLERGRDEAMSVGYGKGYQDGYDKGFQKGMEWED